MNIHEKEVQLLEKYYKKIEWRDNFYIEGSIPEERLNNAMHIFANGLNKNRVIGFYDLSSDGSKGYIFTDNKLYYKDDSVSKVLNYDDIKDIEIDTNSKGENTNTSELRIKLNNGVTVHWNNFKGNVIPMYNFWTELLKLVHSTNANKREKSHTENKTENNSNAAGSTSYGNQLKMRAYDFINRRENVDSERCDYEILLDEYEEYINSLKRSGDESQNYGEVINIYQRLRKLITK